MEEKIDFELDKKIHNLLGHKTPSKTSFIYPYTTNYHIIMPLCLERGITLLDKRYSENKDEYVAIQNLSFDGQGNIDFESGISSAGKIPTEVLANCLYRVLLSEEQG